MNAALAALQDAVLQEKLLHDDDDDNHGANSRTSL